MRMMGRSKPQLRGHSAVRQIRRTTPPGNAAGITTAVRRLVLLAQRR
jgi:hypothetical protein